jgi:HSP20 family molecular chaperone IbpA
LELSYRVGQRISKIDILDHDNEIEVQAALPGIKKEDLDAKPVTKNQSELNRKIYLINVEMWANR